MISGGNSSGGEDPCSYDGKRKSEMTAEERAKHDRERNRVHARNTRARKKQYMEELKERVENMHVHKAAVERKQEDASKKEQEQIGRWSSTLSKVLDLRCEGATDEAVWKELLSEDFQFSLPLTPYRAFDPADVEEDRRRVMYGVEGMISDTVSLTEMCITMAERCRKKADGGGGGKAAPKEGGGGGVGDDDSSERPRVHLECYVGSGDLMFSADEGVMCVFNMCTVDASEFGSPLEVEISGMVKAGFTDDGKLDELEMMFDGVAVHQQLQRAMGCNPSELQARISGVGS